MALRVLVTRPVEDAAALTKLLVARGCEVVCEPMLSIHFLSRTVDIADVQAVLITSANGARALATAIEARTIPVFAVGDTSSKVCSAYGFTQVTPSSGTVTDLARLVRDRLRPENGALLHAASSVTAGDLGGQLRQAGFFVRKVILYEASPVTTLTTAHLIADGAVNAAFFYSPRTAAIFSHLVNRADIAHGLTQSHAYCLSESVRSRLSGLPWQLVRVASVPEQNALLAVFDHDQTSLTANRSYLTTSKGGEEDMTKRQALGKCDTQPPSSTESSGETRLVPQNTQEEANPGLFQRMSKESGRENLHVKKQKKGIHVQTTEPTKVNSTLKEKKINIKKVIYVPLLILLILITFSFVFFIISLWRDYVPDPYRSYFPTIGTDARGMEWQRAIASLRRDLDELLSQMQDLRQSSQILEQKLLLLKQPVESVRQVEKSSTTAQEASPILQRLAALEAAVAELASTETRNLESLTHQTTTFDSRLSNIGARLETVVREQASATTLAALHDRLIALEKKISINRNIKDISFKWLLSIAQLREAVYSGAPFTEELHTVRALAQNVAVVDQAVTDFMAYAVTGLPTRSAIATRFESLHRKIARVAFLPEGESWLTHALQRLQGTITIRRTDGTSVDEGDTLKIMAKASTAIHAGDFIGAIRIMESLHGKPAQVAASWMVFARARAAADEALSRLTAYALGHTAAHSVKE